MRWAIRLSTFRFILTHRAAAKVIVADALSRYPGTTLPGYEARVDWLLSENAMSRTDTTTDDEYCHETPLSGNCRLDALKETSLNFPKLVKDLGRESRSEKTWSVMGRRGTVRSLQAQFEKHRRLAATGLLAVPAPLTVPPHALAASVWNMDASERSEWIKEQKEDPTIVRLLTGRVKKKKIPGANRDGRIGADATHTPERGRPDGGGGSAVAPEGGGDEVLS